MKNINGLEKKQNAAENNTLFSKSWNLGGLVGHDLEVTVRSKKQYDGTIPKVKKRKKERKKEERKKEKERKKVNKGGEIKMKERSKEKGRVGGKEVRIERGRKLKEGWEEMR